MDRLGRGPTLSNKKKMGSMIAIIAIATVLIGSTAFASTAHVVEAKSKHKVNVVFGSARGFDGKVTLKLKNLDIDKVLLKETIDFKKLNKRSDCCEVTYSFDPKGSHEGNELLAKAIVGGGSWESAPEPYKKGTIHFSIDLDEIGQ